MAKFIKHLMHHLDKRIDMNKKQFLSLILASFMGAAIAVGIFQLFTDNNTQPAAQAAKPVQFTNYKFDTSTSVVPEGMNFVYAAKSVTPGVVHIKTTYEGNPQARSLQDPFDFFHQFGIPDQQRQQREAPKGKGAGSGVIITADGYIVTNNHVVEKASEIEVVLNDNRSYAAEVVGTDPTTDLAVLKIEGEGLPQVPYGNSDVIQVGEWVLAVGNPFDFRSTVTAGIVSAKGRNINILRNRNGLQIESFIQTDAAVNPGNSGGALVNLRGELVGINTAIATPTGSYAGYSFAVPVSLVKKVVSDLIEFGVVQRALLGIQIRDVDAHLAEEEDLSVLNGVYVVGVNPESGAKEAGVKKGDVIVSVAGDPVSKVSQLQEKIALRRPGDRVNIKILRDGKEKEMEVELKNLLNNTNVVEVDRNIFESKGAKFRDITDDEKEKLDIKGGVQITDINSGNWKEAGIKEGFIITRIDKKEILSSEDLSGLLSRIPSGEAILVEGYYSNGDSGIYGVKM